MNKNSCSISRLALCLVSVSALSALSGCTAAEQQPTPIMPVIQPFSYSEPAPTYSNPGSLYSSVDQIDLYSDGRARRIGDIVRVDIVESANASNSADTSVSRDGSRSTQFDAFFGKSSIPLLGTVGSPMLGTSSDSDFTGSGTTSRSNTITATVAARVVHVYPDGLLQVEGIRETRVNAETQYIVVRGLVRTRDVGTDNSILSTQMADAQIQYYGSGIVADQQKPGWLARLLDTLSPF